MAREEHPREDLLREATALVQRAELKWDDQSAETTVVGFRRTGAVSLFFGAELVLQFNDASQLRRAYYQDRMVVADAGTLCWLGRTRTAQQVRLERQPFTGQEAAAFLEIAQRMLAELLRSLQAGEFILIGQVPSDGAVIDRIQRWLEELPSPLVIARRPHAS